MSDLKNILIKKDSDKISPKLKKSNIDDILSLVESESKKISNNWNKLPKSKKKKIIHEFIQKQKTINSLSNEETSKLTTLLLLEFNNNNINKNSDVIYIQNKLESIKPLIYNKKTKQYTFKKNMQSKTSTKSKSNIERILKN